MVIPIDLLRTGLHADAALCPTGRQLDEPDYPVWDRPTRSRRGIGYALLLSAVLWVGLILGGRALIGLLQGHPASPAGLPCRPTHTLL